MASPSPQEIELKRRLVGPRAAERLLEVLGPIASDVEQVNHVFDTPDRCLQRARHSFRLRQEAGRFILTAKGPTAGVSGSFGSRTEAEAAIEPELAQRILGGQHDALGELRRRVTDAAFAQLWEGLDQARAGQPLRELGRFHNRRRSVEVALSPELHLTVEVDRTRFPDGRVDDEVEIEIARPELAGEVEAWLAERAAAAGIETEPSTSKFGRFYSSLDGSSGST